MSDKTTVRRCKSITIFQTCFFFFGHSTIFWRNRNGLDFTSNFRTCTQTSLNTLLKLYDRLTLTLTLNHNPAMAFFKNTPANTPLSRCRRQPFRLYIWRKATWGKRAASLKPLLYALKKAMMAAGAQNDLLLLFSPSGNPVSPAPPCQAQVAGREKCDTFSAGVIRCIRAGVCASLIFNSVPKPPWQCRLTGKQHT